MNFAQRPIDNLAMLSWMPAFDTGQNLGQDLGQYGGLWEFAAEGAMEAYASSQEDEGTNTDQSEGMPGSRTSNKSVPRQPSALTTVSTAVVTQVSPQISPVMTQQQSSPGATVGASPMQFMPGGLSADQAITPYGSAGAPGYPTNQAGISPYQPYTMDPATGQYVPIDPTTGQPITTGYLQSGGQYSPVRVGAASMTDIPWIPIAIIGAGVGLAFFLRKRK